MANYNPDTERMAMEAAITQAICDARHRGANEAYKKFQVWGTDGCMTCDLGRITMFVVDKHCVECRNKTKE